MHFCEFCKTKYFKDDILPKSKPASNSFVINGGVLVAYKGNEQIVSIPSSVLAIGENAFLNCISIKEVDFSNSVTEIRKHAFEGCTSLLNIKNYDSVQVFDDECFKGSGLAEVTIGENVRAIGRYAFAYMPNLKKVIYVPKKDLKLNGAFAHCPQLEDVAVDQFYFFPSFHSSLELKNNYGNKRPTYTDAFVGTPFIRIIRDQYIESYKSGICPECGGKISKGLFHAKCKNCGIDFRN